MIKYDVLCDKCKNAQEVYSTPDEIDNLSVACACGGEMKFAWLPKRYKPFPSFTTPHLAKYNNGQPMEITSLHQIRELEHKYADRGLLWEVGSYDNEHYGAD